MADPWKTPTLLYTSGPYCPCVLAFSLICLCPLRICVIRDSGRPFLYSAVQSSVRSMASNARDRSMSMRRVLSFFLLNVCFYLHDGVYG